MFMKKMLSRVCALALCLTMAAGMAACGDKGNDDNKLTTPSQTTTGTQASGDNTGTTPPPETTTDAKADNWDGMPIAEIMQKLVDIGDIHISSPELLEITPAEAGYLQLGELDFAEGALYIPMISSQRFDFAVFRVKEGVDAKAFAEDLKERNSKIQWMCAAPPDVVIVEANGDVVLYLSINSALANSEAIKAGFLAPSTIVSSSISASDVPVAERTLEQWYNVIFKNDPTGGIYLSDPTLVDLTSEYELKNHVGLSDASNVVEAYYVDAVMSAVPFATTLVRINDSANIETTMQSILNGVNPNKWVCTGAEKVIVVNCDRVILMVMCDTETADNIADAFIAACGNVTGVKFERVISENIAR